MVVPKQWFTVEGAAHYLRVSKRTIYKMTQEGSLTAFRMGRVRHRRFRREDLDKVPFPGKRARETDIILPLNAKNAPVLAEIWDNEKDAAYDQL